MEDGDEGERRTEEEEEEAEKLPQDKEETQTFKTSHDKNRKLKKKASSLQTKMHELE